MKLSRIKENFKFKPSKIITFQAGETISISTTVRRLLTTGIFTTILLLFIICNTNTFIKSDINNGTLLYLLCLLGSVVAGGIMAFKWELPLKLGKHLNRFGTITLFILTMTLIESFNGVFVFNWATNTIVLNFLFYSLLFGALYALCGSFKTSFFILTPILSLLSLTNHYIYAFRGTPFLPMDLFSTATAVNFVDKYYFSIDYQIVIGIVLMALCYSIAFKLKTPKRKISKKIIMQLLIGLFSLGILISYYTSDFLTNAGLSPFFFNQEYAYHESGFALNFWLNTKYVTKSKPEGYNAENIEGIVNSLLDDNNVKEPNDLLNTNKKSPNIICVMNESLSDLSVLGEIKTNKDYMPFLRSLTKNTIKGNLYVPVIGGSTSNSEFEFLTGTSMAFLPAGCNAYTLYVKDELKSLTSTLQAQGYSSGVFHPYLVDNWNRPKVYSYMGFDRYDGMELFFNNEIMEGYNTKCTYKELKEMIARYYPNDNDILTRAFVSDSYNYKTIIDMYEQRDTNKPFYMFNITMQNHGPYIVYPDFSGEIYLVNDNGNKIETYPETNQYLSLVYESDKAFEELINYFEAQKEPTIICMFGDHQPAIEEDFITETLGATSILDLNIQQTQSRYVTPFYIWANYDIEEKEINKLSLNYLSSYLMQIAGLEMPIFNQYLLKLSETLPVIDAVGYIDKDDNYYIYNQKTQYSNLIKDYEYVCYNYIFDQKNKCNWLYQ